MNTEYTNYEDINDTMETSSTLSKDRITLFNIFMSTIPHLTSLHREVLEKYIVEELTNPTFQKLLIDDISNK